MATSMQFGDLNFQFTDQFEYAWKDQGSGGKYDGSFWNPVAQDKRFRPLGSIGFEGYGNPNGKQWALCVAGTGDAVVAPSDYVRIWNDTGSGADDDGSCWRPVPPNDDYVACGDVFVKHYDKPSTDLIWCVRKDLVSIGTVGPLIWSDQDTGADKDFSAWQIDTPVPYVDAERGLFAANTFIGVTSHKQPSGGAEVFVLNVPIPAQSFDDPTPPALTSYDSPPLETPPVVDRVVMVPFTAVKDEGASVSYQVNQSPFYSIRRSVYYSLLLFGNNQSSESQLKSRQVAVGVTETQTETFSSETAITVGFEVGIALGDVPFVFSGKISASVTQKLGYARSTAVANFESVTLNDTLSIPSKHAAASWGLTYSLQLYRADGTAVGRPLIFNNNGSFLDSQYPPADVARDGRRPRPQIDA